MSGLITLGSSVQSFHYEQVVKQLGGCPITILRGDPETGKSLCLKAALSLFGGYPSGYFVKGTNAFFVERASDCSLLFVIDDPNLGKGKSTKANYLDVNELVVDMYNGAKTANALRGSRTPLSIPIIASNFPVCGNTR